MRCIQHDLPDDTLTALSRWMMWRVDGLTLIDLGADAVDEITAAVTRCHRLIDKPAEKQYLGNCDVCDTGKLYATPAGTWARCASCDSVTDAAQLRADLLASLDDRLCTPGEIARLSTYLGLNADRERVRKYVEYLARKDRITRHPALTDQAVYRFGEVYEHLMRRDYGKKEPA